MTWAGVTRRVVEADGEPASLHAFNDNNDNQRCTICSVVGAAWFFNGLLHSKRQQCTQ